MKAEVQTLHRPISYVGTLRLLLNSTRPREWVKNTFVFAPLFFSQNLLNPELLAKSLVAFAFFCLASGGVYLINDICDRDRDKKHPKKSTRPIASGQLPIPAALITSIIVLGTALIGAFLVHALFGLTTFAYVILNIAYSNWIKHAVILDVFSIAGGFVLRLIGGAVVIDVVMSHWLLICTVLLALFLGFSKRRGELLSLAKDASLHRRVLAEYNPLFLDLMIGIVTSATLVSYILYTVSVDTVQRFHTDQLILTVPFVLYGIFRYLYLVYHKCNGGDPLRVMLMDGPLLLDIVLWGVLCGVVIYGEPIASLVERVSSMQMRQG
jgi:4-hydroxybenzoate polyprenyltransferase